MGGDVPCDEAAGLCASLPPARQTPLAIDLPPACGNGILDPGEQCETDADCASDVEGCSECQCIGAVLVTLRWANDNSVALRVIDPHGTVFAPPLEPNAGCINTTNAPDENVFFPPGRAALGCYRVEATLLQQCPETGGIDTDLDLRLNVEGDKATTHDVPGPSVRGDTFVTTFGVRAACSGPPPLP